MLTLPPLPPDLDRRRYPRVAPPADLELSVPFVDDAEVIDISSRGILLSMAPELRVGQRAHVRVLLHREPFSAMVEVLRVDPGTQGVGPRKYRVGALIVSMDDSARRTLRRFLGDEKRPE